MTKSKLSLSCTLKTSPGAPVSLFSLSRLVSNCPVTSYDRSSIGDSLRIRQMPSSRLLPTVASRTLCVAVRETPAVLQPYACSQGTAQKENSEVEAEVTGLISWV